MLRNLSLLAIFTFLALSWTSCQQNPKNEENTIPDRLDKSLLWEISGKGIKKSYVFGTIHMISEKDFLLTEQTKKAITKCKQMVMEIDMSQMMQTSVKLLTLAPMKEGKKLSDLLSPEDYQLVKDYFAKESGSAELKLMPFEMLEKWKPMLLQSFLYKDMVEGEMKAYEMELLTIGIEQKMTFSGLETIEDQVAVFEKIPYTDQAKALVDMIKDIKKGDESGKAEFKKLVEMYLSQDVDGMVEMSGEQFDEMKNGEEELLINRNTKWIPKMAEMAKSKPTFFAVGAAHLGGPHGVLRLLMKAGYKVKPVK